MRSSSPEPLTATYHDQHSTRQTSTNPQEFAVVQGVTSNPTSLSPNATPGRAPQLISSTLQHPQSIPLDELSNKSPHLISNGSPQALPPAYTRQTESPSTQHEQPYWAPPPHASPSHANAYLLQQPDQYQQHQHHPYPLPEEQPSSMWIPATVSHPSDTLQPQQAINYSPGITGSTTDPSYKPVYITSTSGRRKRNALWGSCLFIVILAIVLGVVFGVVLKDKGENHQGGGPEENRGSRTTSTLARTTSTRIVQPTPTETLGPATTTQHPTQAQPPATTPPADPFACQNNCWDSFQDCLDACNAEVKECEAPCGGSLSCENPCRFKGGDCRMDCHSASRRCRC